jgi:phage gpG-like protein
VITASYNLSKGPLEELSRQLEEAQGSYVKVGVIGASAGKHGKANNRRWKTRGLIRNVAGNFRSGSKFSRGLRVQNAAGKISTIDAGFLSNAEIGAIHEFGSPGKRIPERSFLRMPIMTRLDRELRTISKADWKMTLITGGLGAVLRAIGQAGINVIGDAFHTGGFGSWKALKPATIRNKGSSDILVDTTQLRRSISYQVVGGGTSAKKAIG